MNYRHISKTFLATYGMMKPFKVILLAAVLVLFSHPAYSYLSSVFNAKRLTHQSDVVCKIRVTSLARKGVYKVSSFHPPLKVKKVIVEAKVISVIKGNVPDTVRIVHPEQTQMVAFTALSRDVVTIAFLKRTDEHYKFTDIHNGKMACVPSVVKYEHGEKPEDRMLSEMFALCRLGTGRTRLGAVERLGELGDIRASKTLRGLSKSSNPALRGVALVSRIQVGDTVKQDALLEYLGQDPTLLDRGKSLAQYQTSAYTISGLTGRIMHALENSIQVQSLRKDMMRSRPSAFLADFDYVVFYKKASALPALVDCPGNRRSMAYALRLLADKKSIPLVKRLLDDSSSDVRYLAVTALTRIHQEGPFPSSPKFKSSEEDYISYWKDRLAQTE